LAAPMAVVTAELSSELAVVVSVGETAEALAQKRASGKLVLASEAVSMSVLVWHSARQ